ncbi:hypothetical protein N7491_009876 [Penicillium cf. griseofulvum]|uniref:GXWXG domain-containing protein n=1 Tax=Penicillium cf. griseofulvum TaxID=2972120 RepID=A0A9W9T5A1_9EURO|nr:hypothetical protein N7472_000203 [Penicillium cf. griseofulvum]KAJ5421431.1 hypothetical protein N7491_009876 [Penicillium cf. griseofulvum]KAJ5424662.1 hypothetical protein N7445_010635 [Penicillium cf. griseofulvum]
MSTSAVQDEVAAIITNGGKVTESEIETAFNKLPALPLDFLHGEWKGGVFDTGHPGRDRLGDLNWVGKTFHSTENVDPIVVSKDGKRVCDENWGHAVLREVRYRGVVSTAMIYNDHAIIDHFRYVNDDLVIGAMDTKRFGDNVGICYFYLYK